MIRVGTADGSFTAFDESFREHYHSTGCGAFSETMQKHIIPSFDCVVKDKNKEELNILDICFGLGFNSLAAIAYAKAHYPNLKINIFSPEINKTLVKSLNEMEYPREIHNNDIINAVVSNLGFNDGQYRVDVEIGNARDILRRVDKKFDIIFQDAFSPKKNKELWSEEYFGLLIGIMSKKAAVTTYSQASNVRYTMSLVGLNVYEISHNGIRNSTLATNFEANNLKKIDMLLKLKNSPNLKPIKDEE